MICVTFATVEEAYNFIEKLNDEDIKNGIREEFLDVQYSIQSIKSDSLLVNLSDLME